MAHTLTNNVRKPKFTTVSMGYMAIFAVLITICSWISIPLTIPFTMQTFAIFLAFKSLGGKYGTISVLVYITLGIIGLPVFASFGSGFGVILGPTGGYLLGFIFSGITYRIIEKLITNKPVASIVGMIAGLLVCYIIGTVWFMTVYGKATGGVSILYTLSICVFPFIIPDIVKIFLAQLVGARLAKQIKFSTK